MGRPRLADSQRRYRRASLAAVAALGLLHGAPLVAGPKDVDYPSTDLFRRLQLDVLDCGRENNATSCDAARKVADPLMDHPRLPASCKDLLWTIREKAVVAPTNTFTRREQLNRAASDLMPICRERDAVKPVTKPAETKGPTLKF
jgi:hypothetical protein